VLRGRENLSHEELSPTKGHEVASTNRRLFVEATSPDDFGPFPELPVVRKSGRQAADATTRLPIGRAPTCRCPSAPVAAISALPFMTGVARLQSEATRFGDW
jgi:hypothetical protein